VRGLTGFALVLALAGAARGHFVFVYVEGAEARLVFGHRAAPDPDSFPTRAENTALTARGADGKEAKLAAEKGDGNFFRAKLPGGKAAVVYGTTEAGVTQRGDNPPLLSFYYPKAITGDPFAAGTGTGAALELVPVRDGDKVKFKVLANGKPAAGAEVTVGAPGVEKDQVVKADADGLTEAFAATGRYCVAARRSDEKPGEFGGKKYVAVRHTATLVCDVPARK
jgi:uncharacterized GH25 family protein